ncbi:MAG: hypothetical protein J1F07_09180, partial [Muribaculaceae bacterium]|nr:hypothetical protein [Muribaculaceae bacterium]
MATGTGGAYLQSIVANPATDASFTGVNGVYTGSVVGSGKESTCFIFYSVGDNGKPEKYYVPTANGMVQLNPSKATWRVTEGSTFDTYADWWWWFYSSSSYSFTKAEAAFELNLPNKSCTTEVTKLPDPLVITFTGDWAKANVGVYNEELDEVEGSVFQGNTFTMDPPAKNGYQFFVFFDEGYEATISGTNSGSNTWMVSDTPDTNPDALPGQQFYTFTVNTAVGDKGANITFNITEIDYSTHFNITGDTKGFKQVCEPGGGFNLKPLPVTDNKFSVLVPADADEYNATELYIFYDSTYKCAVTGEGIAPGSDTYYIEDFGDASQFGNYPGQNAIWIKLYSGARAHNFTIDLTAPVIKVDFTKFEAEFNTMVNYEITELYSFKFTWNYPVAILDPSKIYVDVPGVWGQQLTGADGLECSVEGNSLVVNVANGPLVNKTPSQQFGWIGVYDGGISVNGQTLENDGYGVSKDVTWAPGTGGVNIDNLVSVPARGINHQIDVIDQIELSMEGFWIGYSETSDSWSAVQKAAKIYVCDEGEGNFTQGTPMDVTIQGVNPNVPGGSRWFESIIVKPATQLNDNSKWYYLVIPGYNITFKNIETDHYADDYTNPIEFVYTVAGEGAMTVVPGQYQYVDYSNWKGLVLGNAVTNGVKVADASLVKLYSGMFDSASDYLAAEPLASGVSAIEGDDIVISFPNYDVFNGTYTLVVEDGALTGVTNWTAFKYDNVSKVNGKDFHAIFFSITGHAVDINSIPVTTVPANGETLESVEEVKVWWGNNLKLITGETPDPNDPLVSVPNPVSGKMTFNSVQSDIIFDVVRTTQSEEGTDDGLGGGIDGAYYYTLVYTPEAPLADGEYTFTIPAEALKVYINSQNEIPNAEVSFSFTVAQPNFTYVLNGPIFLNGPEKKEMNLDGTTLSLTDIQTQPQLFNIQKMNGEKVVETYGPATDADGANILLTYGEYQGVADSQYKWNLPANTGDRGMIVDITFDLTTLKLNLIDKTPKAPEYITVEPVADPVSGTTQPSLGTIEVRWPGVKFENLVGVEKNVEVPVDASKVKIFLDGVQKAFPDPTDMMNEGSVYVVDLQGSNEAGSDPNAGGASGVDYGNAYVIKLPDMAFFWKGEVKIEIAEGAVTSTTGEINKPVTLIYNVKDLFTTVVWNPQEAPEVSHEFNKEEVEFYAWWYNADMGEYFDYAYNVELVNSPAIPIFYTTNGSGQIPVTSDQMKADGKKLTFNFNDLAEGSYVLTLPEGTVRIYDNWGTDALNGETSYYFTIVNPQQEFLPDTPEEGVLTIDPANNSTVAGLGQIELVWSNVVFDLGVEDNTPKELDNTFVTVHLDGLPMTEWRNNGGYVEAVNRTVAPEGGNEPGIMTAAEPETEAVLMLYFGDDSFNWTGNLSIVIPQGLVKTTDGAINAEMTLNYTLEEPKAETSLIFSSPIQIAFTKNVTTPVSVDVPVSIVPEENAFQYKGLQFDITTPDWLAVKEATLNSTLKGSVEISEPASIPTHTFRVMATLAEGTSSNLVKDIVTMKLEATNYSDVAAGMYDVIISNPVYFSSVTGQDILINGFDGQIEVTVKAVSVESVEIESVEVAEPSFSADTMIDDVTVGEDLDITVKVTPADTTDVLEWTSDVDGVEFDYDETTGELTVDTSGVDIKPGEQKTVTVTGTIGEGENQKTVSHTFTLRGVILGDSNNNQIVTVADVVTTANVIATVPQPVTRLDFPNANVILTEVDGEQQLNVLDLTATVNIALDNGKFDGNRNPQNVRRHTRQILSTDRLVADNYKARTGEFTIGVQLEDSYSYSALETLVEVPAGMTVKAITAGPRLAGHEIAYGI